MHIKDHIGKIWDEKTISQTVKHNWWQEPRVVSHINQKVCGSVPKFIASHFPGMKFKRGISIGCGNGSKEMTLVESGLVESFDLYELSIKRIESGRKLASARGLSSKVNFIHGDAFQLVSDGRYDLVYWHDALHHMLNTINALEWSKEVMVDGGVIYINEFVGPTRFQWSDRNLAVANAFRQILPSHYFVHPGGGAKKEFDRLVTKKSIEKMISLDPSEAADSENIIPGILKTFPSAKVIPTGGAIYHLALSGLYANIDLEIDMDAKFLDFALMLDDLLMELGEFHYAVAVAQK